jgi:hypothetical protein
VFAQDQVSELPPPAVPASLEPPMAEIKGDSHADLLSEVVSLAGDIGYTVEICDTGRAEGLCYRDRKLVTIADRLAPDGQLAVGIRELAHALVAIDELAPQLTYAEGELVVESVAYCACQIVGLDTDENSIPYLASWAEKASLDVLERTAQLTSRLTDRIEPHWWRPWPRRVARPSGSGLGSHFSWKERSWGPQRQSAATPPKEHSASGLLDLPRVARDAVSL